MDSREKKEHYRGMVKAYDRETKRLDKQILTNSKNYHKEQRDMAKQGILLGKSEGSRHQKIHDFQQLAIYKKIERLKKERNKALAKSYNVINSKIKVLQNI